jgi:hypothetical protein
MQVSAVSLSAPGAPHRRYAGDQPSVVNRPLLVEGLFDGSFGCETKCRMRNKRRDFTNLTDQQRVSFGGKKPQIRHDTVTLNARTREYSV